MSAIDDIDKYQYCGKMGYFISMGQFRSPEVISTSKTPPYSGLSQNGKKMNIFWQNQAIFD